MWRALYGCVCLRYLACRGTGTGGVCLLGRVCVFITGEGESQNKGIFVGSLAGNGLQGPAGHFCSVLGNTPRVLCVFDRK